MMPTHSIIICTYNRAEHLDLTLDSLAQLNIPDGAAVELLVVDNGSTDRTAEVARSCRIPQIEVRYIAEPTRGKSHAYNTGMAAARGGVLLFTDDDVRVPRDWIFGMSAPILSGQAHGVAGGVRFAPHLCRPWMDAPLRAMLADTGLLDPQNPQYMAGANMAFSSEVPKTGLRFDTELGPGAMGFGDDNLITMQMKAAGYRVVSAFDVEVEHHFEAKRLSRASLLDTAVRQGRVMGYLAYHWEYQTMKALPVRLARKRLQLAAWRARNRELVARQDRVSSQEALLMQYIAIWEYFLGAQRFPRKYERFGLVKLNCQHA